MKKTFEIRTRDLEVRASQDGNALSIGGYAAMFDDETEMKDYFEIIRKGAFTKTLQEADVRAFFNHNQGHVLGRTKNNSLNLEEDDTGLRFELELPNTSLGKDTFNLIERGDVDGMSFGFLPVKQKLDTSTIKERGKPVRELKEVRLIEVSVVPIPAYESTSVSTRAASLDDIQKETSEKEEDTPEKQLNNTEQERSDRETKSQVEDKEQKRLEEEQATNDGADAQEPNQEIHSRNVTPNDVLRRKIQLMDI